MTYEFCIYAHQTQTHSIQKTCAEMRMIMNRRFSFNKAFWGLLFILAAVGLILNQFHFWPNVYNISIVSVVFTLFFFWMFIQGLQHKNFFAIIFALAFLLIQYNKIFSFFPIKPSAILGAALLASIGFSMLFPKKQNSYMYGNYNQNNTDDGKKNFESNTGNVLHFKNTFGSSIKYANTDSFEYAALENNFGELKVYFDNAIIHKGIADININNNFGSMVLFVPKTWNVELHTKASFAGVREQGMKDSQDAPILRIYGQVSFGELLIVYI